MPLRAAIFDYGGVLALEPPRDAVERLLALSGLDDPSDYWERWLRHRLPYDRGDLTGIEFWRLFAADAGRAYSEATLAELVRADAESWMHANEHTVGWLRRLAARGVLTAILSNMPAEVWEVALERFDWIAGCAHVTVSFEIGSIKPEPEIYRHCLAGLGVEPGEALFVDDREENVLGARVLGIEAVRFDGNGSLEAELDSRFG